MEGPTVSQVAVYCFKAAVVGAAALVAGSQVLAQSSRADILERIAPVGQVTVAGQPVAEQPAAAAEVKPMAESKPAAEPAQMVKEAPAPAAQPEPPAAAAATAQPAGAGDGAALFVAKTCSACHGADANSPIMPAYPRLAGQNAPYLAQQLKDIKSGARNHGQTMLMKGILAGVSDDEINAIADWLSKL